MTEAAQKANFVIIRPRVTEKAGLLGKSGIYVFDVRPEATKAAVAKEIFEFYKVKPADVRLVNFPPKAVFTRGRRGRAGGGRKAYVVLKKGDKLEIV
ncbi:MAG: 50S ribosomal protein L23 [Candidatus Taylorbacteria bacterium]|nr:50S ribosomal protein L23 [Candidatus Taylorbacteria bacterium]